MPSARTVWTLLIPTKLKILRKKGSTKSHDYHGPSVNNDVKLTVQVARVKGDRPTPVTRLFGRQGGIVEPALIEKVSGAVRTCGPRERGDRVNHKANQLFR